VAIATTVVRIDSPLKPEPSIRSCWSHTSENGHVRNIYKYFVAYKLALPPA